MPQKSGPFCPTYDFDMYMATWKIYKSGTKFKQVLFLTTDFYYKNMELYSNLGAGMSEQTHFPRVSTVRSGVDGICDLRLCKE